MKQPQKHMLNPYDSPEALANITAEMWDRINHAPTIVCNVGPRAHAGAADTDATVKPSTFDMIDYTVSTPTAHQNYVRGYRRARTLKRKLRQIQEEALNA